MTLSIKDQLKDKLSNLISKTPEDKLFSGTLLITYKGEVLIEEAFKMSNYELNTPNTIHNIFRIGSVTKQFTAAAILKLVEDRKLNLGDTLDKFIQDYPKGDKITVHNLLCHSSGIYNYTNSEDFVKFMPLEHTVCEMIDRFKDIPLDFEPGEDMNYSNSGYHLLGYIIEKASGVTYEEYLQEKFFHPLGLNSTGCEDSSIVLNNRASGYGTNPDSDHIFNCSYIHMSVPYSAGNMYSTVHDLHKWNNALHSKEVLSEESLALMRKVHSSKVVDDQTKQYGYGLFISPKRDNFVFHGGGIPGFLSMNSVIHDHDIQVIGMTNITNNDLFNLYTSIEEVILETIA